MNAAAILALIGDLYTQINRLQGENEQLRAEISRAVPSGTEANPNPGSGAA